ncbi:MAG: hypothetical protein KC561_06725 [Myxococcales bacterium]|nr:hypothetical protein [Myxococcales bacterium]
MDVVLLSRTRLLIFTVLFSSTGCSIETTPPADGDLPLDPPEGAFLAERYGIGAGWYEYDDRTHVLTPRDEVYRLGWEDREYLLDIESYYDADGTSGVFSFRYSELAGSVWGEEQAVRLTGNVKTAPVCYSLEAAAEVDCASSGWELVFRTDSIVVPAAGFAVANPAIYARPHAGAQSDMQPPRVSSIPGSFDAAIRTIDASGSPLRSVWEDAQHGLLVDPDGSRTIWNSLWLTATADFHLTHWGAVRADNALVINTVCVPLASTEAEQVGFEDPQPQSLTLSTPGESTSYLTYLIDLCGDDRPSVVESASMPYFGVWPSTTTFDLIAEWQGQWLLRLSPGTLSRASESPELSEPLTSLPAEIWQ